MNSKTFDETTVPTCGAVIRKQQDSVEEVICGKPAATLYSIADPDDGVRVQAIILLCSDCTRTLESGTMMIFKAEDGGHIAVQLPGENNHDDANGSKTTESDDAAARDDTAGGRGSEGYDEESTRPTLDPSQEDG